jgi:hypothetical protein
MTSWLSQQFEEIIVFDHYFTVFLCGNYQYMGVSGLRFIQGLGGGAYW